MPRRILGQDRAAVNPQFLSQVGREQQAQTQILAQVFERSRDTATAINQNAINSLMATREALNTHAMIAAQRQTQPRVDIFQAVAEGLENFSTAQKVVLKDVLAKQDQLSEQEFFLADLAMEQLVANGEQFMLENSPEAFETLMHQTLGNFKNLNPKQMMSLYRKGYGSLATYNDRAAAQERDMIQSIRDEMKAQTKYRLRIRLDGVLSDLEVADGNEDELFKRYDATLNEFIKANPNMTLLDIADIQSDALKWLADSSRTNQAARSETNRRLVNLQNFYAAVQNAKVKNPNNPQAQQQLIQAASIRYDISSSEAFQIANPTSYLKELVEVRTNMQKLQDIETKRIQTNFNRQTYEDSFVGFSALRYLTDVQYRATIDSKSSKDNLSASIKNLASDITDYNDLVKANKNEIFAHEKAIGNIDKAASLFPTNFVQGKQTFDNSLDAYIFLLEQAGEQAVLGELQQRLSSEPPLPDPTTDKKVQAEAVKNWNTHTQAIKDLIIDQINLRKAEIEQKGQLLDRYGIRTPERFQDKDYIQQLQQNYQNLRKQAAGIIEAIPEDQPTTGANANFP